MPYPGVPLPIGQKALPLAWYKLSRPSEAANWFNVHDQKVSKGSTSLHFMAMFRAREAYRNLLHEVGLAFLCNIYSELLRE